MFYVLRMQGGIDVYSRLYHPGCPWQRPQPGAGRHGYGGDYDRRGHAGQIAAFLTALHIKGETDAEIAGMAEIMRAKATVHFDGPLLDTCGTGGDASGTFNISTVASFIAAGAGATVAKHGNRAASRACGSADVLEALGVNIELDADGVVRCLTKAGIGFMFAQKFHPAMRYAGPVRRDIGIRTAFNIIGPLSNPAHARHQVLGVADASLAEKMARALARLDTVHTLVVHGDGGLDELAISGPNVVFEVRQGQALRRSEVHAADLGLTPAPKQAVLGGSIDDNVATVRAILTGEETGPKLDIVLLNAAAALVAADRAADLREGIELARASLALGQGPRSAEQHGRREPRMTAISLRDITQDNWRDTLGLSVHPEQQRFIADYVPIAAIALAKAYVRPGGLVWAPYAIYADADVVGLIELAYTPTSPDQYWVFHFFIDQVRQGQGYGKAALKAFIELVRAQHTACRAIQLTVHPENHRAQRLYRSAGFRPAGREQDGEPVYRLNL